MAAQIKDFLAALGRDLRLAGRVAHVENIPPRPARHQDPDPPLDPRLARALSSQGVTRLYSHQALALDLARAGRDLAAATPTASGKTLV
jgi:DEAD/DEAH box helicase domain-containing protein